MFVVENNKHCYFITGNYTNIHVQALWYYKFSAVTCIFNNLFYFLSTSCTYILFIVKSFSVMQFVNFHTIFCFVTYCSLYVSYCKYVTFALIYLLPLCSCTMHMALLQNSYLAESRLFTMDLNKTNKQTHTNSTILKDTELQ